MDPRHLIQLAAILDKGSITAAARHLGLTQPTLTRNMSTLEMQAHGPLFSRSRFGVRSTQMGEDLSRQGRAIAQQVQMSQQVVSRHTIGLHAHLRIATGPLIGMALIHQLVEGVMQDRPDLSLSIASGRPTAILDQLADGAHDIAIAPAVFTQVPLGLKRDLLIPDEISIFCGPSHPLAQITKPTAEQLDLCEWLNFGISSPFQNTELEMLSRSGIQRMRTPFTTTGDAVMLLQILMKGRHLAVLPRRPMTMMHGEYPVVEICPPAGPSKRDLFIWYRAGLQDDANFQAVVKQLITIAGSTHTPQDRSANGRGSIKKQSPDSLSRA